MLSQDVIRLGRAMPETNDHEDEQLEFPQRLS
jgi:hypothetical protein